MLSRIWRCPCSTMKKTLLIGLFTLLGSVVSAQRGPDKWEILYSNGLSDLFKEDLISHHVYSVQKLASDGHLICSMKLDKNGPVTYWQNQSSLVDSFVYDDTGALIRQYVFNDNDSDEIYFVQYEWAKSNEQISTDCVFITKDGKRDTDTHTSILYENDTTFTITRYRNKHQKVVKSYTENGIVHEVELHYNDTGKLESREHYYKIYDQSFAKKYKRQRLLEEGRVADGDEFMEILGQAEHAMFTADCTTDTLFINALNELPHNPDIQTLKNLLKKYHYPSELPPGKRIKKKENIYDAVNRRLIRQIDFETGSTEKYTYDNKGRIIYLTREFPCGAVKYTFTYGDNGLLTRCSKVGEPERDVIFKYTYFPGYRR